MARPTLVQFPGDFPVSWVHLRERAASSTARSGAASSSAPSPKRWRHVVWLARGAACAAARKTKPFLQAWGIARSGAHQTCTVKLSSRAGWSRAGTSLVGGLYRARVQMKRPWRHLRCQHETPIRLSQLTAGPEATLNRHVERVCLGRVATERGTPRSGGTGGGRARTAPGGGARLAHRFPRRA